MNAQRDVKPKSAKRVDDAMQNTECVKKKILNIIPQLL